MATPPDPRGEKLCCFLQSLGGEILLENQQLRFGVFREGVFQKMPALEGQFLKEISVKFAGENHLRTQTKTQDKALRRGS